MWIFLAIVAVLLVGIATAGVMLAKKIEYRIYIRNKTKRHLFLLRWFLIGKYHCNLTKKQRKVISALNKAFWGIFVICVAVCVGDLIQWILS